MRNLDIDEQLWRYRVGRTYVTVISPEGKRYNWPIADVKGLSDDAFCKGRGKHTSDERLTPSELVMYIRSFGS